MFKPGILVPHEALGALIANLMLPERVAWVNDSAYPEERRRSNSADDVRFLLVGLIFSLAADYIDGQDLAPGTGERLAIVRGMGLLAGLCLNGMALEPSEVEKCLSDGCIPLDMSYRFDFEKSPKTQAPKFISKQRFRDCADVMVDFLYKYQDYTEADFKQLNLDGFENACLCMKETGEEQLYYAKQRAEYYTQRQRPDGTPNFKL